MTGKYGCYRSPASTRQPWQQRSSHTQPEQVPVLELACTPQPPPALALLTLTAAAGQATSHTAEATENPSKYTGKTDFPSCQASNRLLQQCDPS